MLGQLSAAAGRDRVLRKPCRRLVFSCGDYFLKGVQTTAQTHSNGTLHGHVLSCLIAPRS